MPDLRGFGGSDKHAEPPRRRTRRLAQARSVAGLIDELGLERPLLAGYDIGSRIAQAIARDAPARVRALVVSPPLPGAGERVLTPEAMREFWYQSFHQLSLIEEVLDGDRAAVRAYLAHFWSPLVGPGLRARRRAPRPPCRRLRRAGRDDRVDRLVPRGLRDGRLLAGRDRAGAGAAHRHCRSPSCGRSTTRSFRARGPTASTRSSAPPSSSSSAAPGTSRQSRRPRRSPRRSALARRRSRAARRARSRPGPSAPPSPPGARAP